MLSIVRHGRTAANASGLLLGHLDPGLDERGIGQAQALASAIGPVDRVVMSPLLRTRQTAEALELTRGGASEIDERWIEMDYGEFDGRPVADIPMDTWSSWRTDLDWAPPDGESHRSLGIRIRAALEDLCEEARTREVVVVTHVSPIKAALAWTIGAGDEIAWRTFVEPASIMRIGFGSAGPTLRGFNDTSHLGAA